MIENAGPFILKKKKGNIYTHMQAHTRDRDRSLRKWIDI